MANKHLKKNGRTRNVKTKGPATHTPETPDIPVPKEAKPSGVRREKAPGPKAESTAREAAAPILRLVTPETPAAAPDKTPASAGTDAPPEKKRRAVTFRRTRTRAEAGARRFILSPKDTMGAVAALTAAMVLLAASVVIWLYRDRFDSDNLILSTDTVAVAQEEYVFDAGSGQAFAAAGQGLAVANGTGLELLNGEGVAVTSKLMQMENPTAAGCADYAVFYDLGGTKLAVADFEGNVQELSVPGEILSATVSEAGYMAVTTTATGYRAMVTVYDPELNVIYEWYSSSAWIMSACVSPESRQLAVLSYTSSGSEVRFFDLSSTDQQTAFSVTDTVLLDVHWFSERELCAISSEQMFFFDDTGAWKNTYTFSGQYLTAYTFDGSGYAAVALSPYRTGTVASLVSLDAGGNVLGTADVDSGIVCLTARDAEIMVLCADGAVLYNSSLSERGRLTGLPGFKFGLLRDRGEALLIASNYADVYQF